MGVSFRRDKKKFLILGIVFFSIFVGTFLFLFNKEVVKLDMYHIETYFSDVQGLKEAAPVNYLGIQVGSVDQVRLLSSNKVKVSMALNRAYQIPDTVIAQVQSSGVLGDKYIHLSGSGSKWLYDCDKKLIESKDPIQIGDLYEKSQAIIDNLYDFSVIVNEGLKNFDLFDQFQRTAHNLNQLTQEANTLVFQVGSFVSLLENFTDKEVGRLSSLISSYGLVGQDLLVITGRLNSALAKIEASSGSLGLLINDASLYENLKNFSNKISNQPSLLLFSRAEKQTIKPKEKSRKKVFSKGILM